MEWILVIGLFWGALLGIRAVMRLIDSSNDTGTTLTSSDNSASRFVSSTHRELRSGDVLSPDDTSGFGRVKDVHHFHHVKVTHEYSRHGCSEEQKDHTAKVWKKLGYRIKSGESYAYRYYGREIFKPHQVEKLGEYRSRIASSSLSDNQIKVKTIGLALLEKTGSKRQAKDILVENYGFSEKTAKYAVGYQGYYDY